jgi:hypothetical protein
MDQTDVRPSQALRRLVNGYQVAQAIHVAAKLHIADLLAGGARTSDALAAETGAHPSTLYRLLRALASVGVLREDESRSFSLTEVGACLRSDAPEPVSAWAEFIGEPYYWNTWAHLLHSVQTGENAFGHLHGMNVWEFRADKPDLSAGFDRAMTSLSRQVSAAVLATYDFGRFGSIVDVGGGRGAFLAAILAQHPTLQGVLFDQPHVVSGAEELLMAAGVAERCRVVSGSFFEAVPEGADAYVLKAVVHDWEDNQAIEILATCRRAMSRDATMILVEREVAPPNEGRDAKFSDLNMLVAPGGTERTQDEFATLFTRAGFRLSRSVASASGVSAIEAVPA